MVTQPFAMSLTIVPVEAFVLIATRLLAALSTSPVISARLVPGPARIGLGLFLALVMLPAVTADPSAPVVHLSWTTIAGEAVAGALAGFSSTVVYTAVQFGAGLVDVQAGFGLGSIYDPSLGGAGAVLERFYGALAAILFLEVNAHHALLLALRELFAVVPLGQFSLDLLQANSLVQIATGMFRVALQLVLPVVGALMLTDVAFAVLARVAPQFNLWAVGAQAKIMVALGALLVTLPVMLPRIQLIFSSATSVAVGVFR